VGDKEGRRVGLREGEIVGAEGVEVGDKVGFLEGAQDGEKVGFVGYEVGAIVGTNEIVGENVGKEGIEKE
jgi:hypothetical protein